MTQKDTVKWSLIPQMVQFIKMFVALLRICPKIFQLLNVKSVQSCLILCDPLDCNPPGSSVHEIFQSRIWEWVVISGDLPNPGIKAASAALAGRFFTTELLVQISSVTQSCPTLCNPMDCSTPGFTVHHQLPELAQIHVHQVGDAIQPSHPLSSPSPPTFNLSQHQGLFR